MRPFPSRRGERIRTEGQSRRGDHAIEVFARARDRNATMPSINDGKSCARALMWSGRGMRESRSATDEATFVPKPQSYETRVTDDDRLQA